jgi:recombination protein RecA
VTKALEKLITKAAAEPITGPVTFSSTGLIGLDWALGGGVARGRLTEFHGLESSGKSTIGLQTAILEAARVGKPALWLDYEYAWDDDYVDGLRRAAGVTDAPIAVAQPLSIEKGFELAIGAMESGDISSVWFDSTGVMVSEEKGVASMTNARAMAQNIPSLIRAVAHANVVCGFISQTREVISTGGFGGWSAGPKRKATGGAAIKFAFSQRVEFTHKAKLKGKAADLTGASAEMVIGRRVISKVVKNKVAVPWREMEFDLVDGVGFDRIRHLVEVGVEVGVIGKKGAFFDVPGLPKSVQGLQTLAGVLRDPRAEKIVEDLSQAIKTALDAKAESVETGETELDDQEVTDGSEAAE